MSSHIPQGRYLITAVLVLPLLSQSAWSAALSDGIETLLTEGKANLMLRYRFEHVEQDGFDKEANASTLLSRFTWTSGTAAGFSGLIQVDNVTYLGPEDFNNTENGKTDFPVVADPEYTEVNQAHAAYQGDIGKLSAGRQNIVHGSQRFIGGVAWRQNEQTFDALRAVLTPVADLMVDYSYIWNVNRIFGPEGADADLYGETHALRADYKLAANTFSGFVYALDFDNSAALSSNTYGVEYTGHYKVSDTIGLGLQLTYAEQQDAGNNPADYSAPYYLVEASGKFKPLSVAVGYEVLGSDDGVSFQTPLATLHKFQGFADKFLVTPAGGMVDTYLTLSSVIAGVKLSGTYHSFEADEGSADYGTEIDLAAAYAVNPNLSLLVKYAGFDEDGFSTDTDKLWLMGTIKF